MLETLALMGHGFVNAMSLSNLLFMAGGTAIGIIIGCLPGLSAAMGGDLSWKRMALAMLVSMVCAVVTYLVAVVKTRAITLADLQLIPKGEKLAKVLHIR